eukprot:169022_1
MKNINKFTVKGSTPQPISTLINNTNKQKIQKGGGKGGLLAKVVLGKKKDYGSPTPMNNKLKCELVKDEKVLKIVKLFDAFDKYFDAIKGDNGKGIIVNGYINDTFKDLGIGIGWKLSKLGGRSVSKTSFVMLKTQLIAKSRTAKQAGYELTFINESVSTPNSPLMFKNNNNLKCELVKDEKVLKVVKLFDAFD